MELSYLSCLALGIFAIGIFLIALRKSKNKNKMKSETASTKLFFLFWNTEGKDSNKEILDKIIAVNRLDIIVLAECPNALTADFMTKHNLAELTPRKVEREIFRLRIYYVKRDELSFEHLNSFPDFVEEDTMVKEFQDTVVIHRRIKRIVRVVLLELQVNGIRYLFACIHFPSKNNEDEISQLQAANNYKRYLLEHTNGEMGVHYDGRVIIAGDFNMNPFDAGMVEPHGFYALNHHDLIRNPGNYHRSPETMLYNPCWWLMGDYNPKTDGSKLSGTHYFGSAPSKNLYWHLFDQVLLSKNMIDKFSYADLELLEINELVDELNSRPRKKRTEATYADHLPLKYAINF